MRSPFFALILGICLTCGQVTSSALAQDGKRIPALVKAVLVHSPSKGDDLPPPGTPITLKFRVKNLKISTVPMRAFVTKDGRTTDYTLSNPRFNANEELEYELTFPAPLASIVYQFALYPGEGDIISSARYDVRRSCLPNISLAADQLSPSLKADEKLKAMVTQAKDLERDDANYQRIIALVNDIKQILEGQ